MNGIKGSVSIREASYRWGVSERRVPLRALLGDPGGCGKAL